MVQVAATTDVWSAIQNFSSGYSTPDTLLSYYAAPRGIRGRSLSLGSCSTPGAQASLPSGSPWRSTWVSIGTHSEPSRSSHPLLYFYCNSYGLQWALSVYRGCVSPRMDCMAGDVDGAKTHLWHVNTSLCRGWWVMTNMSWTKVTLCVSILNASSLPPTIVYIE